MEGHDLPLVDLLYKCFIKTCNWKNDKSLLRFYKLDPGLYILYNNITFNAYIGETNNIERRFLEHKAALMSGSHFNRHLSKSINAVNIEDLSFFIVDYGLEYLEVNTRKKREVALINNWPGCIYNRKDVNIQFRSSINCS